MDSTNSVSLILTRDFPLDFPALPPVKQSSEMSKEMRWQPGQKLYKSNFNGRQRRPE